MRGYLVLFALISTGLCAQEALNRGVAAFKDANYQQAIELFQQEIALHPNEVNPYLYLGTTYMTLWIPGLKTPENEAHARSAEVEFKRVLELDGNNTVALASMASLSYNQAASLPAEEKNRKFDEANDWYKRLAAADPANKEAPYSMGVIAWAKWYPALMTARVSVGMRPEDPGPLPETVRGELKAKYSSLIEEGITNLNRALALDPQYDDAMAYLNLLIRERADLRDTEEQYEADVKVAEEWVQKTLDTKKAKAQAGVAESPRTSGGGGGGGARMPVRDGGMVQPQTVNPVVKVDPVYPPLAMQARVQGTVRFTVRIAKDGSIQSIQLISGHPLLVKAAQDAVKQYVYDPVVVNGERREAITQVDINFVLKNP
jgi:TonB family protein